MKYSVFYAFTIFIIVSNLCCSEKKTSPNSSNLKQFYIGDWQKCEENHKIGGNSVKSIVANTDSFSDLIAVKDYVLANNLDNFVDDCLQITEPSISNNGGKLLSAIKELISKGDLFSYVVVPILFYGHSIGDDSGSFHFEPGRGIIQTNGELDVVAHEFNHAFAEWAAENQSGIGYGAVEEGYGIAVAEIASNKDLYLAEKVFGTKLFYKDFEGEPDYTFGLYDMNPSVKLSLKEFAARIRVYDKSGYNYKTTDELNAEYKRNWECLDRSSSNYAVIVNPLPTITCEQRRKVGADGGIQPIEQVENPILVSLCNNLKGIDTCGKSIKNYSQYNLAAEDLLVCGTPNVEIKKCESCLAKAYDPNKTPSENYDSCQEQNPPTGGGDPPVDPTEIGKDQLGIPICQFEDSICKQQHCDSLSGARKWICQCYVFNSNGTYFHESIGRNNCQEWCYQDSLNTNNENHCSWESL